MTYSPAPAPERAASSLLGGAATSATDDLPSVAASYSLAPASGDLLLSPDAPSGPLRREGGECCPAPIQAFVDTWVGQARYRNSDIAPRDFTFKAVIGEPDW